MFKFFIVFIIYFQVLFANEYNNRIKELEKIESFKPTVFITKDISLLYDKPNGKAIMKFNRNYKFTAYQKSGKWIKVSGHFPKSKWRKIRSVLWIKVNRVEKIK